MASKTKTKTKPKKKTQSKAKTKAAKVEPKLEIIYRKVDDLIPYAKNARTHSDDQILKIINSIKTFGFLNPVLIEKDSSLTAGHGRVIAAQRLGMLEVPTIFKKFRTRALRRAYIIADNKIGLDADWDFDILKEEMEALRDEDFDLDLTGFDEVEVEGVFFTPDFPPTTKGDQGKIGIKKSMKCPKCNHEFEY